MKKILLSLFCIIVAIAISYHTAEFTGITYSSLFGSGNSWIGSENSWNFIIGLPLSLIFFLIIFSYPWVFKSWKSTLWLISPLLLWELTMDMRHIYIPTALAVIGFAIAWLLRKIFVRQSSL